jgi:hypothetical protein
MLRPGVFQGAGARADGRPRGIYVVDEEDVGRDPRPGPGGERTPDIFLPVGERGTRLGPEFPRPPQEERVAGPSGKTAEGEGHQCGKVVPPLQIFRRTDRYGDDRRPEPGREAVGPCPADRLEEHPCEDVRHVAPALVLGGPDSFPHLLPVGEQGQGEVERPVLGTGGNPLSLPAGGPGVYRPGGEVGRRGGEQRPKEGDLGGKRPGCGRKGGAEAPPRAAGITGRWRGWRVPGGRGRWRIRSRPRRRSSGGPT